MIARIRAKFVNAHIVPLEPFSIEDGVELSVDIDVHDHSVADRLAMSQAADIPFDPPHLDTELYRKPELS